MGVTALGLHLDLVWVTVTQNFHGSGDGGCVLIEYGGVDGLEFNRVRKVAGDETVEGRIEGRVEVLWFCGRAWRAVRRLDWMRWDGA